MEKGEPLCTVGGSANRYSHCGRIKHRSTLRPSNSTSGYVSEKKSKTLIWKDLCTPMSIAALFTIAKTRQPRECPSADEQIKKWCNGCYSAIKKNEIPPCMATWVDLGHTMRSDIRQTKTNTKWFSLYVESKERNEHMKQTQRRGHRERTEGCQMDVGFRGWENKEKGWRGAVTGM